MRTPIEKLSDEQLVSHYANSHYKWLKSDGYGLFDYVEEFRKEILRRMQVK